VLHITNGESVTGTFRQVRFPGTYLAWNDVLHDGPVPQTETLSELSDIRAQTLAAFGCGDPEELRAGFAARDRTLQDFRKHQDVVTFMISCSFCNCWIGLSSRTWKASIWTWCKSILTPACVRFMALAS
jgi:hypothetical protein